MIASGSGLALGVGCGDADMAGVGADVALVGDLIGSGDRSVARGAVPHAATTPAIESAMAHFHEIDLVGMVT